MMIYICLNYVHHAKARTGWLKSFQFCVGHLSLVWGVFPVNLLSLVGEKENILSLINRKENIWVRLKIRLSNNPLDSG